MKYFLLTLAFVALISGCSYFKPKEQKPAAPAPAAAQTKETPPAENGNTQEAPKPDENQKPEAAVPKQDIPVADAETQKKIDEAIKKFRDTNAKMDEREDAILKTLVGIGAIATPDALKLTLDTTLESEMQAIVLKFFYLLPEKKVNTALVFQLFNDDSSMRDAANKMLVRLTGKNDIGYDATASAADRYDAAKKWAKALGVKGIK